MGKVRGQALCLYQVEGNTRKSDSFRGHTSLTAGYTKDVKMQLVICSLPSTQTSLWSLHSLTHTKKRE